MEKILVSACLLGTKCRYDGKDNLIDNLACLKQFATIISICPEVAGGLSTPRIPCEIIANKVLTKCGIDCTGQYHKGADLALALIKKHNIRYALLKSKSPSCGFKQIYDGTFTKTLKKGHGICAQKLYEFGITIFDETNIDELICLLKIN